MKLTLPRALALASGCISAHGPANGPAAGADGVFWCWAISEVDLALQGGKLPKVLPAALNMNFTYQGPWFLDLNCET